MYSKILIPLDGSQDGGKRAAVGSLFARRLQVPVELLGIVDIAEMARHVSADQASMVRTMVDDATGRFGDYLERVAKNFPTGNVECTVRRGNAAEKTIIGAEPRPKKKR